MNEGREEPKVVFDFKSGRDAKQFAKDVENSGVGLANSGVERYKGKYRVVITGMTKDMHKKAIGKYAHKNKGEFSHSTSEVTPKGYGPYDESVELDEESHWVLSFEFNKPEYTSTLGRQIQKDLDKKFKSYSGSGSGGAGWDISFNGSKKELEKAKKYVEKEYKNFIDYKQTQFVMDESVELDEAINRGNEAFWKEIHTELKKVMDNKYYREFRSANGGQALDNVISHFGKARGWRVDRVVKEIIDKYGRNQDEYVKLSFAMAARNRIRESVKINSYVDFMTQQSNNEFHINKAARLDIESRTSFRKSRMDDNV